LCNGRNLQKEHSRQPSFLFRKLPVHSPILLAGTEEQKQKYIPGIAAGKEIRLSD
jgi:hypothetical protein